MIDKLTIKNAQKRRIELIKGIQQMKVKPGWIKYTRSVLGMTLKDLAKLAGLSLPTVSQAERREAEGKVTIDTLKKLAEAMECEFVYAFVPKQDILDLIHKKAIEKARRTILKADTHMSLEDQKVTEDLKLRIESLAEKLIEKGKIW
jgi:predicted DNA-binding mobile mystery protein A